MKKNLFEEDNVDIVKREISIRCKKGCSANSVKLFLEENNVTIFISKGNIFGKYIMKSNTLVHKVWLISFYLDNSKLLYFEIKQKLIGT